MSLVNTRSDTLGSVVLSADNELSALKSSQPFGSDSTVLKLNQTEDSYDLTFSLSASARKTIYASAYEPFGSQGNSYYKISYQIWVDNMSSPYNGESSSGIGVFTAMPIVAIGVRGSALRFQIINSSLSSKTLYIKFYAISISDNLILDWSAV